MIRNTAQRAAIRQAFAAAGRPLGPQEVLAAARKLASGIGIATVYRAIRELVAAGELVEVELPGGGTRYEPAHAAGHHHHFHCRACNRMFCLTGCPGGLASLTPPGFTAERHEIAIYGLCASCRPEPALGKPSPRRRGKRPEPPSA